ncbi:dUTP diphosphatase [Cutaneotrichosporon oleaginosum]|uniref:Deoxyuridine 5'-triphosphate nucleotidohydrolase n=1 Tax=Cutaneotrichosporon oleaginosum TaxID=879819 RepID=A0A0J1BA72_9TREE|nr:dUTP diphosphatase [Cutaneotrichosporon oleaginosum]KLT44804.1 dUTP diphosphatase [Cutaneotrichosporon oleaginosum]TXT11943.1 hypothetical protein COLE_02353 [Cutaneotrichosporon oleaginosum]
MTVTSSTKTTDEGKKATAKLPTSIMPSARAVAKWIHPASSCACASKLNQPLRVKRLAPTAVVPTRGSSSAAGFDLYASRPAVVPARGKAMVDTDISIALPEGTYGRVAPRSGLAAKHSIDTGAGVIDVDYRGPLKVILFNLSDVDFSISAGDRIAQLILEEVRMAPAVEVDDLDVTERGEGGFGSTGGFGVPPVAPAPPA